MTPEEALGRLSTRARASVDAFTYPLTAQQFEEDAEVIRKALADLAWYRREYPKAYSAARSVTDLRREYDAHALRCPWGRP